MNELQHCKIPTSLKFCLALCYSSSPNSSKFGPSCPQVGLNFFHLAKQMATIFFKARVNPGSPTVYKYSEKVVAYRHCHSHSPTVMHPYRLANSPA